MLGPEISRFVFCIAGGGRESETVRRGAGCVDWSPWAGGCLVAAGAVVGVCVCGVWSVEWSNQYRLFTAGFAGSRVTGISELGAGHSPATRGFYDRW